MNFLYARNRFPNTLYHTAYSLSCQHRDTDAHQRLTSKYSALSSAQFFIELGKFTQRKLGHTLVHGTNQTVAIALLREKPCGGF